MLSAADRAIVTLAARQGGVIALAQARELGLGRSAVGRRLDAGEWARVQPRVFRLGMIPLTRSGEVWAAVLSAGCGVVSGRSAAWWHGVLEEPPPVPEITVPLPVHGLAMSGVRIRRSDLDDRDVTSRRGLPVVTKSLAVLQSLAPLGRDGPALLDRVLQHAVGRTELLATFDRFRRHRGAARAVTLVRAASEGAASQAERKAVALLRGAGLRGWALGHPVGRFLVDIAFVDEQIAVEIDGWAWHHTPARFQADRARQNLLILAGWRVLRFTWADLEEPAGFLRQGYSALAGARVA